MTSSILLRPQPLSSPAPTPTPTSSPSPISTPLPGLQPDLTSSSSSASGSYFDLHRTSSAHSTRRIRFAPLPEPDRDLLAELHDPSCDIPQSDTKSTTHAVPSPDDGFVDLSPSISPDSTVSSARSTPTICPKNTQKSSSKFLRPFTFFRRVESSPSPLSQPPSSLPSSLNASSSSLDPCSSSALSLPSLQSPRLPRISEDRLSFGRLSLFRDRSDSSSSTYPLRPSSPPPKSSKSLHRTASAGATKPVDGNQDWRQYSTQSHDSAAVAGSGLKKRRASSSVIPGAGGGRHSSAVKMLPNDSPPRPSTAPTSAPPKRTVKMLNGRVYGAKRYAAQTLANPFANVRDEPEFVEWGYGGMGSVHASAGVGNDMWKGLQRSERGGALLAGSSLGPPSTSVGPTAGVNGGSGACANVRRKMTDNVPECGMGNVGAAAGLDEDDGSGMAWVKRRRAEKEAKARLEQEAKELERKIQEKRRSGDSLDASMYASTASTTTSLTACTSAASTDLTTPITTPITSRSPSMTDLKLSSSPSSESRDLGDERSCGVGEQPSKSVTAHSTSPLKDEHEHHVLTAVRLSPNISSSSLKHERTLSVVESQTTRSTDSSDDEEPRGGSDEEEEQDDDDDDEQAQDVGRKTVLGAGVEKISRHVDPEAR